MCHFSLSYLRLPPCHCQSAANYRMWHCHPATALTNSLETAILPRSTDVPMSLFHYSHQHIWGCHSATSPNHRRATVTQLLLPITCLPLRPTVTQLLLPLTWLPLLSSTNLELLPSHYSDQHTCHCNSATVLTKTLAAATLQLLKPTHLPLQPSHCPHQNTCHYYPATAPTHALATASLPLLPPTHLAPSILLGYPSNINTSCLLLVLYVLVPSIDLFFYPEKRHFLALKSLLLPQFSTYRGFIVKRIQMRILEYHSIPINW